MADSEVELKLRVDPKDLPRLRALPLLAPSEGPPKAQTLESVYYDTADLRLRRDAVTLRMRRKGRTWLQTVKLASDHAGGAFNRSEWEMPVQGPAPDFGTLDGSAAREKLGAVAPDELKPVFSSHIKRSVRLLRRGPVNGEGGALIEVAIDNGEIRTPDGAALPVSDIELELKDGPPVALYDLALSLVEAAPLHVEIRSKAERGYALAAGEATAPVKAARLILTPESTGE